MLEHLFDGDVSRHLKLPSVRSSVIEHKKTVIRQKAGLENYI